MPKIKRKMYGRTETYHAAMLEGSKLGENNDCAPRAVWIATGRCVPYCDVVSMYEEEGRKKGRGSYNKMTRAVIAKLGYRIDFEFDFNKFRAGHERNWIDRYPPSHRVLKSITTHHMDRFREVWKDGNTYLVYTRGHVGCCVDGVLHDHTRGTATRVVGIWKIVKQ